MNDNSVKKKYQKKIKLLTQYSRKYYNENTSEVSDLKFDTLKKEIIDLENQYSFLKT